jgi:hypothetical protein
MMCSWYEHQDNFLAAFGWTKPGPKDGFFQSETFDSTRKRPSSKLVFGYAGLIQILAPSQHFPISNGPELLQDLKPLEIISVQVLMWPKVRAACRRWKRRQWRWLETWDSASTVTCCDSSLTAARASRPPPPPVTPHLHSLLSLHHCVEDHESSRTSMGRLPGSSWRCVQIGGREGQWVRVGSPWPATAAASNLAGSGRRRERRSSFWRIGKKASCDVN